MGAELLWLLLPIAAASGWFAASREAKRRAKRISGISSDYFKGLNFLLNEQPDKAIEVFIRMVEVDHETVETHFALGYLFRRRGEVDRAIRLHQNLIARPHLDADIRSLALLELGEDYMRAGVFDRAENLFRELVDMNEHAGKALANLRDILQQQQDWDKAIEICKRIEDITHKSMNGVIAQYYCEMSEQAMRNKDIEKAEQWMQRALNYDKNCVRASMLQARLFLHHEDHTAAIKAYQRVVDQDVDYIPEIIEPMLACFQKVNRIAELQDYLLTIIARYPGISPVLTLAGIILNTKGQREALNFVTEQLRKRASVRGLHWLIDLSLKVAHGETLQYLTILHDLTGKLLKDRAIYSCRQCGFAGRTLHWQCPSCKTWNSVKPIHGLEGE